MRAFVQETARSVGFILANDRGREQRTLLATYLRLRLRQALSLAVPSLRFERARVFGYEVHFSHPDYFLLMFKEIFMRKVYRFASASWRPLVLDCGANVGLATLFFKRLYPEAVIIAFEPDPRAFALLCRNVEANGLSNVMLVNKALAEGEGGVDLFLDPENPLATSMRRERVSERSRPVRVEATALSTFVDGDVDFLKIDVEGGEFVILAELAHSRKLDRVAEIAVEYHHHVRADEDQFAGFLALLEENDFGYQVTAPEEGASDQRRFQDILVRAYRKGLAPPFEST
jgi:FkbM family methyltransferase